MDIHVIDTFPGDLYKGWRGRGGQESLWKAQVHHNNSKGDRPVFTERLADTAPVWISQLLGDSDKRQKSRIRPKSALREKPGAWGAEGHTQTPAPQIWGSEGSAAGTPAGIPGGFYF